MLVSRFKNTEWAHAYGILCRSLPAETDRAGLYPTFCKIPVGGRTEAHSHFEAELYTILSGQGSIRVDSEIQELSSGDLVQVPPFARHELENTGADELSFISVYTEDFETHALPRSVLLTASPPTPNGPLHLGHISGPYLANDIAARYLRLREVPVRTQSGTDDHQNYVPEKAFALGLPTETFRVSQRSRIEKGLASMQIHFDEWTEPKRDEAYQTRVQDFATRAIRSGVVQLSKIDAPFCVSCDHFLVDALIEGTCPSCGEGSRGGCETCGIVVSPRELRDPRCTRCHSAAQTRPTEAYHFPLHEYLPLLLADLEKLNLSPRLKELVTRVSGMEKVDVLLTHPDRESSGLRLNGFDQTLHVWFEMAAHYERFAHAPETWIHTFGFDNAFHFLLFIPAILRALDARAKLPDVVITNEFLLLDHLKFSTSRGHAIWADEFSGNIDHLRLYLALQRPSGRQTNFSMGDFETFSAETGESLAQLVSRARNGTAGSPKRTSQNALVQANRFMRDMELHLSPASFDLRQASRRLLSWIDFILQTEECTVNERLSLEALSIALIPFMPNVARALREALCEPPAEESSWTKDWSRFYALS